VLPISNGMRASAITKIRCITGVILFLALLLLVRLYFVQIVHGEEYREKAERQYVHTVRDIFTRGSIYLTTKDGEEVSAATVQAGYLLAIDPSRLDNADKTYAALQGIVSIDKDHFFERAAKTDKTYQEILERISAESAAKIESLDLPAVQLYRNQWRYYPGNDLAARTIGFIGYDGDELVGRYGLERYYDDTLFHDNNELSVDFFAEIFSSLGSLVFDTNEGKKGDVVTAIEPTVARTLDATLKKTQEKWNSAATGGIIINPKTGEIYALNVIPSFNLNDRTGVALSNFQNPLIENVYELGSIIKPLTVAAGLDAGAITPHSTYYDPGCIEMNTARICNFDGKGRGTVSMQEVLNQSLNTGVAHIVKTMGKENFRTYFRDLKLDSETGVDLPGEVHGLMDRFLESPRDIEAATASFGQGIALTPIATVRALSALANGGKLITPHIAREIRYDTGETHEVTFPEGEQVFSPETSESITRMLVGVVDDALRGGSVKMDRYSIAAKTGTAQIADQVNGGYHKDKYLHSFFGYFPAYDPEFLIFLYTVEPKGVQYGSETLTDPFMELTRFLINYYDLPPDR
jgi:stage V sporulation protein D (sporulation-specific penicillin-binding protein)